MGYNYSTRSTNTRTTITLQAALSPRYVLLQGLPVFLPLFPVLPQV